MQPPIFPLRWQSTGDQWWYASPIDWAAANGLYDVVLELLQHDTNLLIKLTSLRRIHRLEYVWDDDVDGGGFHDVARNRCHVARKLLEECESSGEGTNSLIRAGYGGWLLYTAASAGDFGFVKNLLERDPLLVFGEGEYGISDILYAAARGRNGDVFRMIMDFALLPAGIYVEDEEERLTEKQLVVKEEMMKRGLHGAARGGDAALLEQLLLTERYDTVLRLRDAQGATLLHSASSTGQVHVVEYLISKYDTIITTKDSHGNTALHVAAYNGNLPVVKALLLASPSLMCVCNIHGDTFLHMVVSGFAVAGFKRLDLQMNLLKHVVSRSFANLPVIVNLKNVNGKTALHLAAMENLNAVVELLMKIPGVDLNVVDSDGMTPMDLLQRQRRKPLNSEMLIKRLALAGGRSNDIRLRDEHGFCGSPGTLFNISDSEIFLYASKETAIEGSPDRESFDSISVCWSVASAQQKRSGARLKLLLQWAKRAESEKDHNFSCDKNWEDRREPLREMYARLQSCEGHEGRRISMRSNSGDLPSLSVRMKFTERLMKGVVVHKPPRFIFSPPTSDFSAASSSYITPQTRGTAEISQSTDRTPVMKNQGSSRDKKFMGRYLCFGAQGFERTEKIASPRPHLWSIRRAISFGS